MAANPATRLTRRHALAGAGAALTGGAGLLALSSEPAKAQVTMGELSISGDNKEVDAPPSRIDIHVTGEWSLTASSPVEMVKSILQVHVDGNADDLTEQAAYGKTEGAFDLTADLFSHDSVAQGDLTPAEGGQAKTTDLLVRVIVVAVDGGAIVAESFVEQTAQVTITRQGMQVSVGGTGSVSVVA